MAGSEDGTKSHYSPTTTLCLFVPQLRLCFFPSLLQDHLWLLSWEEMWTGRQSSRLRRGECGFLVSSWALTHLTLPSKPMGRYFKLLQWRAEESGFPYRRKWTIIRLKIRGFENYKGCYCGMTKVPCYVLWAKIPFHFHHTQNQHYSSSGKSCK